MSADSLTVKLRYPILGQLNAGAAIYAAKRFTPNSAYDVDPTVGSTSTPGFAEYAALYTYYRVTHYTVNVAFSNLDTTSTGLYICNTNTDPGTGGANYYDYAQNALGTTATLGSVNGGNNTFRYRRRIDVARILGMTPAQADSFRATTTSSPSDLVYWGFGLRSNTATVLTHGAAYNGYIEVSVRFYARQELLTAYFRPSSVEWEAARQIYKMRHNKVHEPPETDTSAFHQAVTTEITKQLAAAIKEATKDDG